MIATDIPGITAPAVGSAGNLFVADAAANEILKRDAQGNWSEIASFGDDTPFALAVDGAGNLYVGYADERGDYHDIQKRDARGNWSDIGGGGAGLAVDGACGCSRATARRRAWG